MMNPYTAPSATVAHPGTYGSSPVGTVSAGAVEALRQTRPWVFFLAILGFIGSGFMVLAGLAVVAMGSVMRETNQYAPWLGLIYLVLAPLYIAPSIKLVKYAGAIRRLTLSGDTGDLEAALLEQKGFWKLVGVMVISLIVLYVLILIGVVVVAVTKTAIH
jgi:hypothetical protein